MKSSGNTILITGGGSGIGLELAREFSKRNNQVIICGRDVDKLRAAESELKNVIGFACDITSSESVDHLLELIHSRGMKVNILINNAAVAKAYMLGTEADSGRKALAEMQTNYIAVVELIEKFLPHLSVQENAAIVNISSVVAFVPGVIVPTYSASKAALHSYTQSLRLTLANTSKVKVFEVMPPVVNTAFSKEIPGANRMEPSLVAKEVISGLEDNEFEMHIGATKSLFTLHKQDPFAALSVMNRSINPLTQS